MGLLSLSPGPLKLPSTLRLNVGSVVTAALVVVLGTSLITQHLHDLNRQREVLAKRLIQDGLVSQLARDLASDLDNTAVEVQTLADWIAVQPTPSNETFSDFSERVLARHLSLRSLTLLPDDIIRYAFPPNASLLGMDVGGHSEQGDAVRTARERRGVVITGPVRLKQGGEGLILRAPVYVNSNHTERYWGHVSAVLGLERVVMRIAAFEREHNLMVRLTDEDGIGLTASLRLGGDTPFPDDSVTRAVAVGEETWLLTLAQSGTSTSLGGLSHALLVFGYCIAAILGLAVLSLGFGVLHLRQQNELLIVNEAKASRATQVKSSFLATMSHELRTPLNGVIATAELLHETPQSAEQVELTNTIASSGKVLLAVVNDILDFSRLETGSMVLEEVPVVLRDLCKDVQDIGAALAKDKDLTFEVEISDAAPLACITDAARLRQVLINLVANAVKTTDSGWVTLLITTENAIGGRRLSFTVTDTGVGIADVSLPFQPLPGETYEPNRAASSLGLAISNRIVSFLGGTINVNSRVGHGSTFSFSVPLVIANPSIVAGLVTAPPDSTTGRCLVVDDNAVNRLVAQKILLRLGWQVDLARGGKEGVELGGTRNYDLILMDVQMPDLDGLQATRELRKLPSVRHTPIVAMTAGASPEDRDRCLDSGMNDHLAKPINLELVRQVLRKWCSTNAYVPNARAQ